MLATDLFTLSLDFDWFGVFAFNEPHTLFIIRVLDLSLEFHLMILTLRKLTHQTLLRNKRTAILTQTRIKFDIQLKN